MGRSQIPRSMPERRVFRALLQHKSTVSANADAPEIGDEILKWMAPAAGDAGPFLFRIDEMLGEFTTFELSVLTAGERTTRLYSGTAGAGQIGAVVDMKAGDRVIVTLKGIKPRSEGEKVYAKGVWVSFTWTMEQQVKEAE